MTPAVNPKSTPSYKRLREKATERNRRYRQRERERKQALQEQAARLAQELRDVRSKPLPLSSEACEYREEWLASAVDLLAPVFAERGYAVPSKLRVALGWPTNKKSLGCCFDTAASSTETTEIFISPIVEDALTALDVLTHELCHAAVGCKNGHNRIFAQCAVDIDLIGPPRYAAGANNPDWLAWAQPLLEKLGSFPHDAMVLRQKEKKQTTRLIKKSCNICGFNVRLTQSWIDNVRDNGGILRCSDSTCAGELE